MAAGRQQVGTQCQLDLFEPEATRCRGGAGEGGTGSGPQAEQQPATALTEERALAEELMERICRRGNLNQAYKRVKANKGSAGIDGMSVDELGRWLRTHKDELIASLLEGTYEPSPVKRVDIPKPGGERGNWAFRRWWTGWSNRRFCKC